MIQARIRELNILFESYSANPTYEIQKDIADLIRNQQTPISFKTKALLFLRKHKNQIDIQLFANSINKTKQTAKELLHNKLVKTYFPVVGENESRLAVLYLIKIDTEESFSFKNGIENILLLSKQITEQSFFVTFDCDFVGSSFMLSLAAAILTKNSQASKNFSFSGIFDASGNILTSDYKKKKEQISKEHSKLFIDETVVKNLDELDYIINSEKIDIPFSVAIKSKTAAQTPKLDAQKNLELIKNEIESNYNIRFKTIKKLYNLQDEDFLFYTKQSYLPDDDWKIYLTKAYEKIQNLKSKIDNKICVFHFSLFASATFSFGLGALFGCKEPFVVYHYNAGKYHCVLNFRDKDPRILKQIPKNTKHIKCIHDIQTSDVLALVFYVASHNPKGDIEKYLEDTYKDFDIVHCVSKDRQGKIPLKDWSIYVREMYKHYNYTKDKKIKKRLFFFSCPVPLAFGFGVDVETFENADVFNLKQTQNSYTKVFNLRKLKI